MGAPSRVRTAHAARAASCARARSTSRPTERWTSAQQPPSPATGARSPMIGAPQPLHSRCPAESARRAGSDSPRQRRRGLRHHHPCRRQTHRQTHRQSPRQSPRPRPGPRRHSSAVSGARGEEWAPGSASARGRRSPRMRRAQTGRRDQTARLPPDAATGRRRPSQWSDRARPRLHVQRAMRRRPSPALAWCGRKGASLGRR